MIAGWYDSTVTALQVIAGWYDSTVTALQVIAGWYDSTVTALQVIPGWFDRTLHGVMGSWAEGTRVKTNLYVTIQLTNKCTHINYFYSFISIYVCPYSLYHSTQQHAYNQQQQQHNTTILCPK